MPRLVANDRKLTGEQVEAFYVATLDAYSDLSDLTRVLKFRLNKQLNLIASPNDPLDDIVFDIIEKADTDGWSANLLAALRANNPERSLLLEFAQQFGLATETPSNLELLIDEGDAFLDVAAWREALGRAEPRVCRIEQDGKAIGTGFLVGPAVVMTNYHVMEGVIADGIEPSRIGLRFDYKVLGDGIVLNPGQVYALATDWDIAHSPYSPLDKMSNPTGTPGMDELDYAMLRVDGQPGLRPVSVAGGTDPKAPARGWVPIPVSSHDWSKRRALLILQHPEGRPLKLAFKTNAVTATLPPGDAPTRVRYSTRTEPGSSGSPCFDIDWNLVAIHHGGDPNYALLKTPPEWNEGIPLQAILRSLDAKGDAKGLLGGTEER